MDTALAMPRLSNKRLGSGFPVWRINSNFCKWCTEYLRKSHDMCGSIFWFDIPGGDFTRYALPDPQEVTGNYYPDPREFTVNFLPDHGILATFLFWSKKNLLPDHVISQGFSCPTHGTSHAFSCPAHVISPFFVLTPGQSIVGGTEKLNRTFSEIKFFAIFRVYLYLRIRMSIFFLGHLFSLITCSKYFTPFNFRAPRISALLILIFPLLRENCPFNFRAPQTRAKIKRSKVHNSFVFVHVWADFKRIHLASTNCH